MLTIEGSDWSYVDDRALTHDGCIVDVGCRGWDWSYYFLGKKRVIGLDPFGEEINGAEFSPILLGPCTGIININKNEGSSSTVMGDSDIYVREMYSWKSLCKLWQINQVSVLKLNVEGSEYSILHSLDIEDYAKIDQIAVSFHDFINPNWKALTKAALGLLEDVGFNVTQINKEYNWWHGKNLYISR